MPTAVSVYTSPRPADVHFDEKTIVHNTTSHLTNCFVADSDTLATVSVSVKSMGTGMEEGITLRQHQEAYILQKHQQQQQQQRQLLYRQQQRQQQHQEYANQLLWQNKQDLHQQLRQGMASNSHIQQHNSGHSAAGSVDLVDDVWRLVFYLLAGRCKDLGRAMLVSRRFYNLIANDAVLWKFTYQRTVSGSIFATSQKVVSHTLPALVDRGVLAQEGDSDSCAQRIVESQNSDGSEVPLTNGQDLRQTGVSSKIVDPPALEMGAQTASYTDLAMRPETDRRERAVTASAAVDSHSETTASTIVAIGPGLMMPSPLILPHHRRMAQSMASTTSTTSALSTPSTTSATSTDSSLPTVSNQHASLQPLADRSIDPQSIETLSGTGPSSGLRIGDVHLPVTPASTPSLSSSSSGLPLTLPTLLSESVSQVVSSSTVPIRVVQHMTPTTTLMHHPPAVYWKHQVVEWLEQEKLRCLRLGLFWGANAATSRVHRRKTQ